MDEYWAWPQQYQPYWDGAWAQESVSPAKGEGGEEENRRKHSGNNKG